MELEIAQFQLQMNEKLSEKIGNIRVKRPQTLALLINNMISAGSRQQSKLYKIDIQIIREIIFFIVFFTSIDVR